MSMNAIVWLNSQNHRENIFQRISCSDIMRSHFILGLPCSQSSGHE